MGRVTDVATRIAALRAEHAARPAPSEQHVGVSSGTWLLIDGEHRLHLCIRRSDQPAPAALEHVDISTKTLHLDGQHIDVVDVTCRAAALDEVFEHFVESYFGRREAEDDAVRALTTELAIWRSFLAVPPGPPGLDVCADVVGELLVARELCRMDPAALGTWVGDRHDFRSGLSSVEVKTSRSTTGYRVTIHGVEQMLPSEDSGVLHLHFVRLEHTPGKGVSVDSLVRDIVSAGADVERVWAALGQRGIVPAQIEATAATTFRVRERLTVEVNDDVPRIVPALFSAGQMPSGVDNLTYSIDLADLVGYGLTAEEWTMLILQLAHIPLPGGEHG